MGGHARARSHSGGLFVVVTVTATPSESLISCVSLTLTRKLSVVTPATAGATKLGLAVVGSDSETTGPPVCVHEKVSGSPSGSKLALASRVTRAPVATVWGGPSSAIGAWFTCSTVTRTSEVLLRPPSDTVRAKVRIATEPVLPGSTGAVKVGCAVSAPDRTTGVPLV